MPESARLGDILFWFMVLLGGALLAPCLILPAWLEYQASLDLRALRFQQVQQRQAEITRLRKQREHLETDDAYVLRLAREQMNLDIPGVVGIRIEPVAPETAGPPPPASVPAAPDELAPELSAMIEQMLERYPLAHMFVRDQTRPPIMMLGAGLLFAAITLVGGHGARASAAG